MRRVIGTPFLLPAVLARAQKVSRVEVAVALAEVRDAERKLILEV
jgi:hypothetical protein